MAKSAVIPVERIETKILLIRGQKVLLDVDLATLYGVETRRLNEQVRRNLERFPLDFMFQLTEYEYAALISQFATSKEGRGGRRKLPLAFTEHGAIMAASVLNAARAIEMSVYVVRAFVKLRELLASHKELAKQLEQLEQKIEAVSFKQDALASNTRAQFKEVFEALRALMSPPEPKKQPIGFVVPEENKKDG